MDILKALKGLGLDQKDVIQGVFHFASPALAKSALKKAFANTSDAACEKLGRLLTMAGTKLLAKDREGAAGDLARVVGEIKIF